MASKPTDGGRPNDRLPRGVRGPGGPPPPPARGASGRRAPEGRAASQSPARAAFERRSAPVLRRMHALPRWIVVVGPAILLFAGLILTGPARWIGGVLLLLVAAFLGWLTALSWPAIGGSARLLRVFVVLALVAVAVLKFMGRF